MKPLDVLLILASILFATGLIVDHTWGPERARYHSIVRFQRRQLDVIQERLREYHEKTSRYPTTAEGLEAVPGLRKALLTGPFAPAAPFLRQCRGIRTIQGIPFVYENRRAAVVGAFRASPAKQDRARKRRFSRRVDDGIYVSSIGLREEGQRRFGRFWLDALLWFCGGVVVFLAVAYVVARNRRSGDRVRGINAMIMVGVAVLLALIVGMTGGGRMSGKQDALPERIGRYQPESLSDYLALMRRFVDDGAVSVAVFRRQEENLRREFAVVAPYFEETPGFPAGDDGKH